MLGRACCLDSVEWCLVFWGSESALRATLLSEGWVILESYITQESLQTVHINQPADVEQSMLSWFGWVLFSICGSELALHAMLLSEGWVILESYLTQESLQIVHINLPADVEQSMLSWFGWVMFSLLLILYFYLLVYYY